MNAADQLTATEALARAYSVPTSDWDAAVFRASVTERELVADWYAHVEELRDEQRRAFWFKLKSGVIAFLISALGVGMFLTLCFLWGR